MSETQEPEFSYSKSPAAKGERGGRSVMRDIWGRVGTIGGLLGTSGTPERRAFLYAMLAVTVGVAVFNTVNVITIQHEEPGVGLAAPFVWEGSSWITFVVFSVVPWIAFRIAPPQQTPWWRLCFIHAPAALLFSLLHVGGFVLLRELIYALAGEQYRYGPFWPHFLYEFRKDILGYVLMIAGFWVAMRLALEPANPPSRHNARPHDQPDDLSDDMITIRDGAKLTRVPRAGVLAIASAGNYVEFHLRDGRRLLMRAALTAIARELGPRGFVRTHRSWLVNAQAVTALNPDGSGDYTIELGSLHVPLSRRFPDALARLKRA